MNTPKQQLQKNFELFALEFGEATTEEEAVTAGKDSFIILDHNPSYGGYRLTRVLLSNHSHANDCYGINSCEGRMKTHEMITYLRGLRAGNYRNKYESA